MRATATQVFEVRAFAARPVLPVSAPASVASSAALIGGVEGRGSRCGIGAGGAIAATDGKDIELPAGRSCAFGSIRRCVWWDKKAAGTRNSDGPVCGPSEFFMYGQRAGRGSTRELCSHASNWRWASSRAMP
jgi:hypothetical protein